MARYPKPRTRQTASAAGGTDGNRSRAGDISLNSLTEAPAGFPGLYSMGNPGSGAQRRRTGRGQDSPMSKALRKQGAESMLEEEAPL